MDGLGLRSMWLKPSSVTIGAVILDLPFMLAYRGCPTPNAFTGARPRALGASTAARRIIALPCLWLSSSGDFTGEPLLLLTLELTGEHVSV